MWWPTIVAAGFLALNYLMLKGLMPNMTEQDNGPGGETWIGAGFPTAEDALAAVRELEARGFEAELAYRTDTQTYIVRQLFKRPRVDSEGQA